MSEFAQAIYNKLFLPGGKTFVVARNRDGLLWTHDFAMSLEAFGVYVDYGDSLRLRLVRETIVADNPDKKVLFVMKGDFDILPDIAQECDVVVFQFQSFFPHYPWYVVKQLSFAQQEKLYETKGIVDLDSFVREYALCEGGKTNSENALAELKSKWQSNLGCLDFNKPTEWMTKAGEILLSALEMDKWSEFSREVKDVNERFLKFLQESYVNIVSSTCGTKNPRIVTQVLPFISKQKDEKIALVVIDGMNWWQSVLLTRNLEEKLNLRAKYDCIYSWLPSVTELSRQAIFRGDIPSVNYVQGPQNEEKLWKEFWSGKGYASFEHHYQHSGAIAEETSVKRLGYVVVDLDEKMHSSEDYMYLYDATKRWSAGKEIIGNIKHLIEGGYKVYITTDHGNIEATAYKKLDQRDKLGADLSYRHITLPEAADKRLFEAEYGGHIEQVDSVSKTYYAAGNEAFTSKERCVTHGGAHWLEVLIPFITLEK